MKPRCWKTDNPLYIEYHDKEWGVPVHDDLIHYEFLVLEGAQAGLSWETILNKRSNYRKAFSGFDYTKVAEYGEEDKNRLISDSGIVRNRRKIDSAINNARRFLDVQKEYGSFDAYAWGFVNNSTILHAYESFEKMPTYIDEALKMSKDMKKRGFTFFGPTICYSYMQAVGMVTDHLVSCFRYKEILELL